MAWSSELEGSPETTNLPHDALLFEWTEEAIAILTALHEVLGERIARAREAGMSRHVRVGLAAMSLLETLIGDRPQGVVLGQGNVLARGVLFYLDAAVAELREMGIFAASKRMRDLGWRTGGWRRGPTMHSPVHFSTPSVTIRSPDRGGVNISGGTVMSPEHGHGTIPRVVSPSRG